MTPNASAARGANGETNMTQAFAAASIQSDIVLRRAESGDGMEMWRIARHRAASTSPWFFVTLVRHLGDTCWIAEQAGEIVGYIVAAPRDDGRCIRILDVGFSETLDTEDHYLVLGELLQKPGYRRARELTFAHGCPSGLSSLTTKKLAPLAKCGMAARRGAPASGIRRKAHLNEVRFSRSAASRSVASR